MTENTAKTPYQLMGQEAAIRALVERFYFFMDTLPEAAAIRAMHAADLSVARSKLFMFLSGWLGGPDLFVQEYGHSGLRRLHSPFAIDTAAAGQWLLCMDMALNETALAESFKKELSLNLQQLARHLINRDG